MTTKSTGEIKSDRWAPDVTEFLQQSVQQISKLPGYTDVTSSFHELSEDVERPLIVVIAGEFKAGKSTLINTLLEEQILSADITPKTASITLLTYGAEKKVIAHYLTGEHEEYDFTFLADLSAEGNDEMKALRKSLKMVELQLPHPLLQHINIVDTPGLNAMPAEHTKVTNEFLHRADMVWWIFNYMSTGRKTEFQILEGLEERIKVVAVINQIDRADSEEDLEDTLQNFERKYHRIFDKIIALSAKEAWEAKEANDTEMWKWSQWEQFEHFIHNEFLLKSSAEKLEQTLEKLKGLLVNLKEKLDEEQKIKQTYEQKISLLKKAHNEALSAINYLVRIKDSLDKKGLTNRAVLLSEMNYLPLQSEEAERMNRHKDQLREEILTVCREYEDWEKQYNSLRGLIQRHEHQFESFMHQINDYHGNNQANTSEEKLLQKEVDLNAQAASLNTKSDDLKFANDAQYIKQRSLEQESAELLQKITGQYNTLLENYRQKRKRMKEELTLLEQEAPKSFQAYEIFSNELQTPFKNNLLQLDQKLEAKQLPISAKINFKDII